MAEIYEIPDVTGEEHQYCNINFLADNAEYSEPQLATRTGTIELKAGTSSGNDASKRDNSTKVFQYIVQCIHILLTLALVGISVYLLQMPTPDEPVVNGSWSQWGAWSTCSLTCGSGVITRFRRCDSPAPSSTGRDCRGNPMEAKSCNVAACPELAINGGWSQWGAWSTCSLTCCSGVTTRFRRCNSPAPSPTGRDCTGNLMEADSCQVRRCSEKQSAFTAVSPTGGTNIRFISVKTNIGNDYSSSTGRFTCQYPGVYFFVVSITKIRSSNDSINDRVSVSIRVNGITKVTALTDPQDDSDNGSYETTATLTTHLNARDYVDTVSAYSIGASSMQRTSHFSGFLVQAD